MRKTLSILFLLAVALCGQASAQLSQCAITATIYDNNGDLLSGARIVVVKVVKNGSLISNSPLVYTTNASGVATFNLPRSSVAWIWANSYGLNANGSAGVAVAVPAAASANLEELAAFSSVLTTLGDLAYGGASGVFTRLAGNTSATAKFLCQQGNGTTSTAPGWCAFAGSGNLTLTYDNNARTATFGYEPTSSELLAAFGSQSANRVLAGPTTGSAASPTFRALVAADIPDLSATYQPLDPDLTTIGGLSPSNDDILQRKAGAWTNRTIAQLKTDLNYATVATSGSASDLSAGTVPDARFPSTLPAVSGANLTALNASNISAGSLSLGRIAQGGASSGQALTWNGSAWTPGAGGTTINATDGVIPYRLNSGAFADSAARFVDASTVQIAGRLGINTSAPGARLDVRPGSTSEVGQIIRLASGQTANALNIENSVGTGLSAFDASGRLGIGTTAPGAPIEAKSGSDFIQLIPASYKLRIFRAGVIDGEVAVSASGFNFNTGITAAGKFVANNSAIGSSSTGIISSSAAGILELRSANTNPQYVTFSESGSGDRGALGFPAGSGNLVYNQGGTDLSSGTRRWLLTSDGRMTLSTAATTNPGPSEVASLAAVSMYVKNSKLVFAYNNSGTITYITIPLDGSTSTFTHSTTAP